MAKGRIAKKSAPRRKAAKRAASARAKPRASARAALTFAGPKVPRYRDLKRPDDTGLPLAWGLWGPGDQLGTINNITPEVVKAAALEVKRGARFNLDLPLHVPYGLCKPEAQPVAGAWMRKQATASDASLCKPVRRWDVTPAGVCLRR